MNSNDNLSAITEYLSSKSIPLINKYRLNGVNEYFIGYNGEAVRISNISNSFLGAFYDRIGIQLLCTQYVATDGDIDDIINRHHDYISSASEIDIEENKTILDYSLINMAHPLEDNTRRALSERGYILIDDTNKKINNTYEKSLIEYANTASSSWKDTSLFVNEFYYNEQVNRLIQFTNFSGESNIYKDKSNILITYTRVKNFIWHATLAMLPVLLPDMKEKLSQAELKVLKLVTLPLHTNTLAFNNALNALAASEEYANTLQEQILIKLLKVIKEGQTRQLEIEINNLKDAVSKLMEDYNNKCASLNRVLREQFAIQHGDETDITDTAEYILKHPYITDQYVDANKLYMAIDTNFSLWEEDLAEILYDNWNYKADYKNLFKYIFIDQVAKMRVKGIFSIDLYTYVYNNSVFGTLEHTPNPHLERYSCYGTHKTALMDSVKRKDIIGIIEGMLNVYKNINFSDSTVVSLFINQYWKYYNDHNIECINYKNDLITIKQFMEIMEPKEVQNEEDTIEL